MQCENNKCKKKLTNNYYCNKCSNKYCSNSCMIDHYFEQHQNNQETDKKNSTSNMMTKMRINKSKNSVTSQFIIEGQFLQNVKMDSYFNYENFEKVKIGKKLHLLGQGAFGDVYLVKHKTDKKFYAVKQMDKQKILNTGANLEVVRREVDIHSRLSHENVIRLFSHYEDANSFYLVLEYANSGTLFSAIKKSKGMEEKKGFKYFIQTAAAIYFLHENKLIHRDIKPENLLLDDKDNIKLCDFGWCIESEIGNRNTFCGTIEYMAPEIIKEMPYDRSIDVWSLGILLYELLHGYSPFRAKNSEEDQEYSEVFKNICKYNFTIDNKDLSVNCKDLIIKLLTPEINSRLKVKDIFAHPWVTGFEDKENINTNIDNVKIIEGIDLTVNTKDDNKLKFEERKLKVPIIPKHPQNQLKNKLENNQNIVVTDNKNILNNRKPSLKQSQLDEIKENLNSQKLNSIQQAINSTRDFSLFENEEKSDSLFDKVLTQVKERNKDKRKKNKFKDDSLDNIIENENKITLKLEMNHKEENDPIPLTSNTKNAKEKKDFKMLKEIKQIESDLDRHIDEQNKKYDSIKNKKDDLNKIIEKDKIELNKFHINKNEDERNSNPNNNSTSIHSNNQSKNNSKNNSINSKNLLNLHPKYANKIENKIEEKVIPTTKEKSVEKTKNKIPTEKIKGKEFTAPIKQINYNDYIYGTNQVRAREGRESHKNQKNSLQNKPNISIDKELDMSFLPKELLYSDNSFENSNKNILAAIELLEKAQETKKELDKDNKKDKSFWSFLNPFKCG